ncbi:hypothetical protein M1N23_01980 [Dehalococcoidia bacterium]|nr:hypothetical protein [Dehalococcoidia bacterium]
MDSRTRQTIQRIHNSPWFASFALAGAGSSALGWLLEVSGASRTILETLVPYSAASLERYLNHTSQKQTVSHTTAKLMAQTAYRQAVLLKHDSDPVLGVSCTATIATDKPKRGEHRCHVGIWNAKGWHTYSLTLEKGRRNRENEELVVSRLILRALAEATGVQDSVELELSETEVIKESKDTYGDALEALLAKHVQTAIYLTDGTWAADPYHIGGILPGSFNPLHDGHRRLAKAASKMLGDPVVYELSVTNVDKPALSAEEIRQRVSQFTGHATVIVSDTRLFCDKAKLFPGSTLVIGTDTLSRLVDPHYYGDDQVRMLMSLSEIESSGCRFLVAGRLQDGRYRTLTDVSVPRRFSDMFKEIPESSFREDLTSSELRSAKGAS